MRAYIKQIISIFSILALMSLYNNCSFSNTVDQSAKNHSNGSLSQSGGNGDIYGGKVVRTYVEPGQLIQCGDRWEFKTQLVTLENSQSIITTEKTDNLCAKNKQEVSTFQLEFSQSRDLSTYDKSLFVLESKQGLSNQLNLLKHSLSQPASERVLKEGLSIQLTGLCNHQFKEILISGDLVTKKTTPCREDQTYSIELHYNDIHPDSRVEIKPQSEYTNYYGVVYKLRTKSIRDFWAANIIITQEKSESIKTRIYPIPSNTQMRPIFIKTVDDLKSIELNKSEALYILDQNIDLAKAVGAKNNWVPIGNSSTKQAFIGVFDGDYKAIKNMHMNLNRNDQGFFGYVNSYGIIKNLVISNPQIQNTSGVMQTNIGAAVGYSRAFVTLENILADNVNIEGNFYNVGGIVGRSWDSYIRKTETSGLIKGNRNVGGVIGESYGDQSVEKCLSKALVKGETDTNTGFAIGGIIGKVFGGINHKGLVFLGEVSGHTAVGGLFGYLQKDETPDLLNSIKTDFFFAIGNVSGTGSSIGRFYGSDYNQDYSLEFNNSKFLSTSVCSGCDHLSGIGLTPDDFLKFEDSLKDKAGFQLLP